MPSKTLDVTRAGAREYTPQQRREVVDFVRRECVGKRNALTTANLAGELGIDGRTVRAILSDADGREFVLAGDDDGIYVAETADDADGMTRRMRGHAQSEMERARRREKYAREHLPRGQALIW